jgi:hypothetical protein
MLATRRECPENCLASSPSSSTLRFTTSATARSESRVAPTQSEQSTARKTGPDLMPAAWSQVPRARTGQVSSSFPWWIPTLRP